MASSSAEAVHIQFPRGGTVRMNRGRRHFENAIWRTFPGKSRQSEDILYIHRPRLKKCLASAITECSASAPGNALPLLLRNVPPSLLEMFRLCYYEKPRLHPMKSPASTSEMHSSPQRQMFFLQMNIVLRFHIWHKFICFQMIA